jgi:hypothetical protein
MYEQKIMSFHEIVTVDISMHIKIIPTNFQNQGCGSGSALFLNAESNPDLH